jgi:hypothetical protein
MSESQASDVAIARMIQKLARNKRTSSLGKTVSANVDASTNTTQVAAVENTQA